MIQDRLDNLLARLRVEDQTDEARFGEYVMLCRLFGTDVPDDLPLINPVIRKMAGYSFEYNNELIDGMSADQKYAHAILTDGPLPDLDIIGYTDAYDLTHRIFYATDFGRVQKTSISAQLAVKTELLSDILTDDIKGELLCCDKILNGISLLTIDVDDETDNVHLVAVSIMLEILRTDVSWLL